MWILVLELEKDKASSGKSSSGALSMELFSSGWRVPKGDYGEPVGKGEGTLGPSL